jgi:hypothetical protein
MAGRGVARPLDPARVKAFRAASLRGWQYAMEHPEEIVDLILA